MPALISISDKFMPRFWGDHILLQKLSHHSNEMNVPRRVFLDTNVVNLLLDYGDTIFEGHPIAYDVSPRKGIDIEALYRVFSAGRRALWQTVTSELTLAEINATRNI